MFGGNGVSLADIAAVTNRNNGNNGMNGWGDMGAWWVLIILFALWGGDGNGFFGGNRGSSATTNAIDASLQRGFDTQSIISKLDGISNGICSLGYDQLAQMNNINQNISTTGFGLMSQLQQCCCGIENAIMQAQFANQTGLNALSTQMQNCCCNLEQGQMRADYNRATDTCAITTAIKDAVTAITQNDNCNFRQLYDQQVAIQMEALRTQNADLRAALEKCDDQNMINAQTQYLTNYLRPQPNPAFVVPAPWFAGNYGYGYNNGGCCCNNGFNFGF